jgi:sugar-specific transcriptional regulator TrmB
MKYLESLTKLGLTPDQAKIYEVLVVVTILPARLIAKQSGVGRELTYIVLSQLEILGLVEKSTQGKITLFRALHPRNIKKIVEEKRESVLSAEQAYQEIITKMVGDFNISHNKPFIRFYEGLEGLQKTYDHIIRHAKTVRVMRSLYDYENEEIRSMVTDQIKKQSQKGIKSYVLTPQLPHMKIDKLTYNSEKNIIRKLVPKDKFILPAQVMIYNNTVSITSMNKEIVTTIIENEDIAKTFLTVFNYIWDRED